MSHRLPIEEVSTQVHDLSKTYLESLCTVWKDLGLDDASLDQRFLSVKDHIKSLFEEMVREELNLAEKLRRKIDVLKQQLNTINIDLDMSASCNTEGLHLMPAKAKLEECLSSLRSKHTERLEQREALEQQERALCQQLGKERLARPEVKSLADEALSQLKTHIKSLQIEKDKLIASFRSTKADIIELFSQLEAQPSSAFEQKVASANPETFSLTSESLNAVEGLKIRLEDKLQQVQQEMERLRERLSQLWERLEVDVSEREGFLQSFPGHSQRTRDALTEEIQRCEELKHQNIERFIDRMRDELKNLWEKCCVSEEEQAAFAPFYSSDFSDELLEAHEAEVRRLEAYFTENRAIFELLGRRTELWERMSVLESKAHDKDRLFQNRGGQLLKEEKERKQLQKDVPHVENELKRMIHGWEERSGEPFLLQGRRALEVLNEQWENRKMDKEREKLERKQAQQKQLEREAVMGTTMLAGVKRKLATATPEMSRKLPRIASATAKAPVSKVSGARAARDTSMRHTTQRRVAARTRGVTPQVQYNYPLVSINLVANQPRIDDSLASSISYTDFSHHLEARATRSTAAPSTLQFKATHKTVSSPKTNPRSNISNRYPHSAPAKPPRQLRSTPKSQTPSTTQRRTPQTVTKLTRTRNNLPIIF